jgi:hypothetical protein
VSTAKLRIITIFLFIALFSVPAFAVPCAYNGTVKIDDKSVDPSLISVYLNDTLESVSVEHLTDFESTGYYVVHIDASDKYIKFKIADLWVSGEYFCDTHHHTDLNLSATSLADGEGCNYSESCSSGFCVHNVCRPSNPYCPCPSGQSCGDDGTCYTPTPPSGPIISGGGGGGIYITPCTEKWNCTDWSECIAGTQTRTCKDGNNCGTTKNKSAESQTCSIITGGATGETSGGTTTPECNEDWTCTDWSDCIGGTRTKTCVDKNNCGTTIGKPTEAETCSVSPTTGLFLSMNTPVGYGIAALILAAIVAIIYFFFKKRKGHKK